MLFNKVQTINQKSGPFDLLLCVGDFFGADNSKLAAYKNGNQNSKTKAQHIFSDAKLTYEYFSISVVVPTYILGPSNAQLSELYDDLDNGEICPNLTYLGRRGLYTTSSGLKIAYISGVESPDSESSSHSNFKTEDVKSVTTACLASNASTGDYRGIDILMTNQWPEGVRKDEPNTSRLLSWLSSEIKPRYHFCGLNDSYFEPPPFRYGIFFIELQKDANFSSIFLLQ